MNLRFFIILLGAIWSGIASGQKVVLSNPTHRAKWPFDNHYRFIVKGIPCSQISFRSDKGKFDQNGCELYYYPDTSGMTTFKVYRKYENRFGLVDSIEIRIDENKEPDVRLGMKTGGTISKDEVLALGGLNARRYVNDSHAEPVVLIHYTVIVLHGDSVMSVNNVGSRYSDQAKSLLARLQSNDILIFADMEASDRRKNSLKAKPIEFRIE